MYEKIMREINEINAGTSPIRPQDLANNVADMLSDGDLTTGQYLEIMGLLGKMI